MGGPELAPSVHQAPNEDEGVHGKLPGRERYSRTVELEMTAERPMGAAMERSTANKAALPGRLQRRKARTQAAILDAASELFARQGYEETSILQVAERADTGVGTVYGYFRSKEALLRAVLNERSARSVQGYVAGLASGTSAVERMLVALRLFASFIQENRAILLATFRVTTRQGAESDEPPAEWLFRAFKEMLSNGVGSGELREMPIDATARSLIGLYLMAVLGIGIFREREDDPTLADDLQAIARVLLEK